MNHQLPLWLPLPERRSRESFVTSPSNRLALCAVEDWRSWPGGKMLLIGGSGSGKSHLAQIWREATGAVALSGRRIEDLDLSRLSPDAHVLIENAEAIAGDVAAEAALFHIHNIVTPGGRLLLTASRPPRDWGLRLPDLVSRLQAAAITRLEAPDDALLAGVLGKLFADRQLVVGPALIPWLVARMPRAIGAARELVAEMDARALAEARPLGLRLAAEVLSGAEAALDQTFEDELALPTPVPGQPDPAQRTAPSWRDPATSELPGLED